MRGPTKHRNSSSPRREIDGETATLAHRYPTDTPTLPSHHIPQSTPFLSLKESERSPAILPLLLLLSGDIEINPGPPPKNTLYPCPTCAEPYSRRKGQFPVLAASRRHATPKSALGLNKTTTYHQTGYAYNATPPTIFLTAQHHNPHRVSTSYLSTFTPPFPKPLSTSISLFMRDCNKSYIRNLEGSPCSSCGQWTHYTKRCSGITRSQRVLQPWFCKKCGPAATPNTTTPQPPNPASTPTTQCQLPITTTSQPLTASTVA